MGAKYRKKLLFAVEVTRRERRVATRRAKAADLDPVMGPVGVGKPFLANALRYSPVRRQHSVPIERTDELFKQLPEHVGVLPIGPL